MEDSYLDSYWEDQGEMSEPYERDETYEDAYEGDDEPADIDGGELSYDPYAGTAIYGEDACDPYEAYD